MPSAPGAGYSVANRYRLDAVIGSGGMGTVWLAHDKLLGRAVALKEMRFADGIEPELAAEMAERAVAEARAAARLHHHRIVTVYDVVTDHDRPWIVMQHVAGRSLTEVVLADGPLPPARVAFLALWLLDALEAAHAGGIIHRDVKPSNVLIPYAGGTLLTDFSIAKAAGAGPQTRSGVLTGSPGYIAPERFATGTVGVEADLFGLGATLYFALEGRGPFDHADPITGLFTSATQPHPPAPHAGPLTFLLDRLLDKNPRTRATVDDAREIIQAYVDSAALTAPTVASPVVAARQGDAVLAPTRLGPPGARPGAGRTDDPAPPTEDLGSPAARGRRVIAVAAGVAVIAVAATAVALSRRPPVHAAAPLVTSSLPPAIVCEPGTLRGDGTSVQSSAIQRWIDLYKNHCHDDLGIAVDLSYPQTQPGPAAFVSAKHNDFAGLDDPLDASDQAAADARCGAGHSAIHLPVFIDPVAIVYHVGPPGGTPLQLRPSTLAEIFEGQIAWWDAPPIVADNPGVALPHTRIIPVHRSDSSVTTQVFTNYLSASLTVWNHGSGTGWTAPGGQPVSGSDGVANYVAGHDGAIGYVYWQFGAHKTLDTARLYNSAGEWIALTENSASTALGYAQFSGTGLDLQVHVDYSTSRSGAYPLVLPIYELVCDAGNDPARLALLKAFLSYVTSLAGQKELHSLYFAPLPESYRTQVSAIVAALG